MEQVQNTAPTVKTAQLYRKVMPGHLCPYGLKAKWLLEREGYKVEDHPLRTPEATEAFKAEHGVKTTPQAFIGSERVGGYDALRERFVGPRPDKSYAPVLVIFAVCALMALSASFVAYGSPLTVRAAEWFAAFSMCVLAILKLQDIESFSTSFLNYDLLARRFVPYSYAYPVAEAAAGILMVAGGMFGAVGAPVALFIGSVGAASVFKAVYLDRRELKCACVGGNSNVPLGFVSLTENLVMIAMGLWMGGKVLF